MPEPTPRRSKGLSGGSRRAAKRTGCGAFRPAQGMAVVGAHESTSNHTYLATKIPEDPVPEIAPLPPAIPKLACRRSTQSRAQGAL